MKELVKMESHTDRCGHHHPKYIMSIAECDQIALQGGALVNRGCSYNVNPSGDGLEINSEYGCRTIATRGMGNWGQDVLVGLTPRARYLLREGKVKKLVREGVREKTARVAITMPWGLEVAKLADSLVELAKVASTEAIMSRRQAEDLLGKEELQSFSVPRVNAAWQIARAVW